MSAMLRLVVAGAHMSGLRLNHQLTDLGAQMAAATTTAPVYRMYSLGGLRPALIREPEGSGSGAAFEVEVWDVPLDKVGVFLRDGVKAPLALGDVLLEDGSVEKGFVGEGYGIVGAPDISTHGGWRGFLAEQQQAGAGAGTGEAKAQPGDKRKAATPEEEPRAEKGGPRRE